MKALTGPFAARAEAGLAAGCDVVLHCDGNLDDMKAVAEGCGKLGSNAFDAMEAVDKFRGKPSTTVAMDDGVAQVADALGHG
jgi:beta-N-acetylhexosaminidase